MHMDTPGHSCTGVFLSAACNFARPSPPEAGKDNGIGIFPPNKAGFRGGGNIPMNFIR